MFVMMNMNEMGSDIIIMSCVVCRWCSERRQHMVSVVCAHEVDEDADEGVSVHAVSDE